MGAVSNVAGTPWASAATGQPSRAVRHGAAIRRVARPLTALAERQRIASALHDDVSSLLFAASATAQRAGYDGDLGTDELRAMLHRVGEQVREASDRLRSVLRGCAPESTDGTGTTGATADHVPAAARRDLLDLAARTGITTRLVLRGRARPLGHDGDAALLGCLRLSLFNVERHADARSVEVTLHYAASAPGGVVLEVVDDGRGLPDGFVASALPRPDGTGWGWASVLRRAEQRGGRAELAPAPHGGTRVRVHLPG